MTALLRFILLFLSVLLSVNGNTHHWRHTPADIIYVDGRKSEDIKAGPKSEKHQIASHNFSNQPYYSPNARYIVQSHGAPTIQTIYESASISPSVGFVESSSESSSEHNNANSYHSTSITASNQKHFIQPEAVNINPNPGYRYTKFSDSNHIGQRDPVNNFAENQYSPSIIESSSLPPVYKTSTVSSENSFASSSSSSSSIKSSSQFNSQGITGNPNYQPQTWHVTTPYPIQLNNHNQQGHSKQLPPFQINYQTPATNIQSFASSSESSSEQQVNSQGSSQSNLKTAFVTTNKSSDFGPAHSISMWVTPTPYTISMVAPQSHPSIPITTILPIHERVPMFKKMIQPTSFSVLIQQKPVHPTIPVLTPMPFTPPTSVMHHPPHPQPTIHHTPYLQPLGFTPKTSIIHHSHSQPAFNNGPYIQPDPSVPITPVIHQTSSTSQPTIPVTEVQDQGVIEKTINILQPGIKTHTYEIRRPAIQKQFFDIEERVIVRPAGSIVVEIDQPLSKKSKEEVIVPLSGNIGQGDGGVSQTHQTDGHNNGYAYTLGNSGPAIIQNHGDGINEGHNIAINTHGTNKGDNYDYQKFIPTGDNDYQHIIGTLAYNTYPNICDQYGPKFTKIYHPDIAYGDQQYQPSNHGVTQQQQIQHQLQQGPQKNNSNFEQIPHMITVGDPDFHAPPYAKIQSNAQQTNNTNSSIVQIQKYNAGDLHTAGAQILYTMQSAINGGYLNEQPQDINQQQQQVNFNQHQQLLPNQQIQNNSSPFIVYAISKHIPNSYIASQQPQPQENDASNANSAARQQIIHRQTPQNYAAYIKAGHQHSISHSPLVYSSSYYTQRAPNTPININKTPYSISIPKYNYPQSISEDEYNNKYEDVRLNTGPSVFPQKQIAYTQPQNYVNGYQHPSQQVVYTPNAAYTKTPQQYVGNFEQQFFNNPKNQAPETLGNQGQPAQTQIQENFVQENNTKINPQLNQITPLHISFNKSDSYPKIDVRNNIDNKTGISYTFSDSIQPLEISRYNSNKTTFNENLFNQYRSINSLNKQFLNDILQQQDNQPAVSPIKEPYENGANDSSDDNNNVKHFTPKSHIISATPYPKYSEPTGERIYTRRIVVNQPLETVQLFQEHIPLMNYKQVTVQQPTTYKTSKLDVNSVESTIPIFDQQQHLPG